MEPQIIRHGEAILYPTPLPRDAELKSELNEVVIAHSETGHNHLLTVNKIDTSKIKVYSWNGETYLEVPQISQLWHQKKGKDTHTPHKVVPATYKVIIKKEFDYFQGVLRQVRD